MIRLFCPVAAIVVSVFCINRAGSQELTPEQKKVVKTLQEMQGRPAIETEDRDPTGPVVGIVLVTARATDDVVRSLKVFPKLRRIQLTDTSVTDEGIKELRAFKGLKELFLMSDKVGDAGMKEIGDLTNLVSLELICPEITEAGLKGLRNLKNLRKLTLGCLSITDANLKDLAELKNLEHLDVAYVQLSDTAIAALGKAHPMLDINNCFTRVPILLAAKSLKPAAGDDALQKAMKARYNAAASELRDRFREFLAGRGSIDVLYETCQRLTRAGMELTPNRDDQIVHLEKLLQFAIGVEAISEARFDAGRIGNAELQRSRYERLDLEVQLGRLKQKPK